VSSPVLIPPRIVPGHALDDGAAGRLWSVACTNSRDPWQAAANVAVNGRLRLINPV
jgi:hypothetical protein